MINTIRAYEFASGKHKGQVRKYTGEPYIVHPVCVAEICRQYTNDEDTIIGAILHDTVEDTDTQYSDIIELFGEEVAHIVRYCSEVSVKGEGNREYRKELDCQHYANGNVKSKMIKVADAIHNSISISESRKDFANQYFKEKEAMVNAMLENEPEPAGSPLHAIAEEYMKMLQNWRTFGSFSSDKF